LISGYGGFVFDIAPTNAFDELEELKRILRPAEIAEAIGSTTSTRSLVACQGRPEGPEAVRFQPSVAARTSAGGGSSTSSAPVRRTQ
jgi:hypothetical protein